MAASTERAFRRFTAIAITHRNLRGTSDAAGPLGTSLVSPVTVPITPDGWSVVRMEYLARRKLYPDHVGDATRDRGTAGYAHDVYVASKDFGGRIGPVVVLASPYVVFLHEMVAMIADKLDGPALQFLGIDMPTVYRALDASGDSAAVNRVTMQVIGEPNADVVALAGKRPLHSKIHETLEGVTVPYGIGVKVDFGGTDCRVGLDRHGRITWFQTAEDRIAHPLALLDRIKSERAVVKVRRFPLEKEPKDATVTAESP